MTRKIPHKVNGFTLIELILVIVILGILTVLAVPRFSDIAKNAKIQSLNAIEGNIKASMSIIYSKALIQGLTKGAQVMSLDNGDTINLAHGYPVPADLRKVLEVSDSMPFVNSNYFLNYPVLVYYFSENQNPKDNSPPFPLPNQGTDCFVMYSVSDPSIAPYAGTRVITNGC